MKTIQQTFSVPFEYTVHFSNYIFDKSNPIFAQIVRNHRRPKIFFVIDEGVAVAHPSIFEQIRTYAEAYAKDFTLCADPLVVPGGEEVKNDRLYVEQILEASNTYGIDRHSFIVAIGGGAVLDMAGFATAIAHRGIRHIRIPTTVLAQNDSGIGVKNSINSFGKKNFVGTFAPPYAVLNDSTFLDTLDDKDWRSGISEAVKVALIKDASFFEWIEVHATKLAGREMPAMEELIYRCAKMHLDHIAGGDPFEQGSSRPLDFGHWAAHKLEQLTNYQLRHGEAVAIGISLDTTYSFLKGSISEEVLHRVINLFKKLGFAVHISELSGTNILKGLEEFREHLGGELTIMLIDAFGHGVEVHQMDNGLIADAVEKLKEFEDNEFTA
ncbi:3-dehydroquinate synthase [Zunongwangia sp. F260]|uniref:3-dehydroquinate synthase n=1 Tax=Autumnicola lenta TaxID=3075593 RepID=A0ABU3CP11_9FLAO|nr:3-dehydroquinate synthase [Zunongwangia sp. F260]MDT0648093.1 3-dehydroquinate synthase [Zunongwangia sp. F260]